MTRLTTILLAAFLALTLTACGGGAEETPVTRQIIAMDTAMSFSLYGENGDEAVQAMVEEVQRLEGILSRTDSFSEIGFLNRMPGQSVEVGEEVTALLERARTFTETTGGAFDITIAPVVEAWGFTTDSYQVPEEETLTELLGTMGMEHVHVDGTAAVLDAGTQVDLGGIAKGYASGCLAEIFEEYGIESGWADLGGNLLAWGPRPDGQPWRVGVRDPKNVENGGLVGTVSLENAFAVTSGGYERFFEADGEVYHHIIDPATGYPADSGLVSVTVVADCLTEENGTMCDALSTALFVMGEEDALALWRSGAYDFDLVLVTEDDRVVVTGGIAEGFVQAEGSGYTYETVS